MTSKCTPSMERSTLNSLLFFSEAVCQVNRTLPSLQLASKRVNSIGRIIKLAQGPENVGTIGDTNEYVTLFVFDPVSIGLLAP